MNVKECVIFTSHFVPPQEFKEFYESIGYLDYDVGTNEDKR